MENGNPISLIAGNKAASSAPRVLATIASSLVLEFPRNDFSNYLFGICHLGNGFWRNKTAKIQTVESDLH